MSIPSEYAHDQERSRRWITTRVTHFFTSYDIFKVKNWKTELWPALAMNRQEDTGRTQPIMFLDMAWDRDSIAKTNDFDFGFQETATPADQLRENFLVINNQSCKRYQLGTTKTVIPMKLMKREDHVTGTTGTANQVNTTAKADAETPWYDLNHITNPTCKQMVTQLHVYEKSVKKNLKGEAYATGATRYNDKTDNFICIPFITSADVPFAFSC